MDEIELNSEKEIKKTIENFSIEELDDYKKKLFCRESFLKRVFLQSQQ